MFLQTIVHGVAAGSTYGLFALGFGVIFQTCRFFHFAHGAVFTISAYIAYVFVIAGAPVLLAFAAAIVCATALGICIDVLVYRRIRADGGSPLSFFIASLGVSIVLQSGVSLVFGDGTRRIAAGRIVEGHILLGARITTIQVWTILTAVVLATATYIWLFKFNSGKAIRALANDPELSRIMGIPTNGFTSLAFGVGSSLAAIAAIFVAYDTDLTPQMGFNAMLMGVTAAVIGGIGSIRGSLCGGLIVGLMQHSSVWLLPSEFQDIAIYTLLIAFLVLLPKGCFGRSVPRATV